MRFSALIFYKDQCMHVLPDRGFVYITGKIESYISFLLSQVHERKTILFYDNEDESLLLKEEIEFFAKKEVSYFPVYSQRIFEKEDESRRIAFGCAMRWRSTTG